MRLWVQFLRVHPRLLSLGPNPLLASSVYRSCYPHATPLAHSLLHAMFRSIEFSADGTTKTPLLYCTRVSVACCE